MNALAGLQQYADWGLLILRLAIGFVFLVHGLFKIQSPKAVAKMMGKDDMSWFVWFIGAAEVLGGIGLIAGLLTQFAAAGLGIIMLGAIWTKIMFWKTSFTSKEGMGWEFDLVLLAICVLFFLSGGGRIALDFTVFL